MAKRTAPIRVISLIILAASGALCQKGSPVDSLPDAPSSVQPLARTERFHPFVSAASSPSTIAVVSGRATREIELGNGTHEPQPSLTALHQVAFAQKESGAFLGKYLYPPLLKPDTRYYASTSASFMGRASYAASRIFVTRDDSGKGRLNTRYFVGVLSSVAMHVAYRPYRARSTSETFNNFGSTIGGDAGMHVYQEFRPGIRQMVKGLTPKFVSRIEGRITHPQIPKGHAAGNLSSF